MAFNESSCPEELIPNVDSGLDGPSQASGGVHATGASQESSWKSDVWNHFIKAADYETSNKAICIHCQSSYVCSDWSTKSLWRHVKKAHPKALDIPVAAGPLDRFFGGASEDVPYSNEAFKEVLVSILARKCLPFVLVEDCDLRAMVGMLRPGTRRQKQRRRRSRWATPRAMLQSTPSQQSLVQVGVPLCTDWEPEWVDLAKDSVERAFSMHPMPAAQNAPTNARGDPKYTP